MSDFEQAMEEAHEARTQHRIAAAAQKERNRKLGIIDPAINHTYLIKVSFYRNGANGLEKACCLFTSNHSATSKRFDEWARKRVELVSGFSHFAEDIYSEHAVSVNDFCK